MLDRVSVTAAFSEPEGFAAALRSEGYLGLLITGRGQFWARLTQIILHRLRLSAGEEQLSRIAFLQVPADMVLLSFSIGNGVLPVNDGIRIQADEIIILSPGEQVHARTDGHSRWGSIWMPVEELIEYGRALIGAAFTVQSFTQSWRPPPAARRHLCSLHAAAIRMAALRPQALVDTETAHGLEQQLIDAVVECLAGGPTAERTQPGRRQHQDIMAHFERLLQAQPDRDIRMTEICAALGVSRQLLRALCAECLGMSPTGYHRLRRMSLVRHVLRHGCDDTASLSEAARRYGFRNLDRFAANYRAAFGEAPSATLLRGSDWRKVNHGSRSTRDRE